MKIYQILPKNHNRRWFVFRRFGKEGSQDCFRQCEIGADMLRKNEESIILIATDYSIGNESEMEFHRRVLTILGVDWDTKVTKIHNGLETIHQMMIGQSVAQTRDAQLVFIVAWVHWLRVKYMAWIYNVKAQVMVARGMPRPWDVLIEILFVLLYPLYLIMPLRVLFKFLARGLRWLKAWASELHWWLLEKYIYLYITISA